MSVAIDTDAPAQEKTDFDADFDTTDDERTAGDDFCNVTCATAFTFL